MNKSSKIIITILSLIIIGLIAVGLWFFLKKDDKPTGEKNDHLASIVTKYEEQGYKVINVPTKTDFPQGIKEIPFDTETEGITFGIDNTKPYFQYENEKVYIDVANAKEIVLDKSCCDVTAASFYILTTTGDLYRYPEYSDAENFDDYMGNEIFSTEKVIDGLKLASKRFKKINKNIQYTDISEMLFSSFTIEGAPTEVVGTLNNGEKYRVWDESKITTESFPYSANLNWEYHLKMDGSIVEIYYDIDNEEKERDSNLKLAFGFKKDYSYYFIDTNKKLYQIHFTIEDDPESMKIDVVKTPTNADTKVAKIAYKELAEDKNYGKKYNVVVIFENQEEIVFNDNYNLIGEK